MSLDRSEGWCHRVYLGVNIAKRAILNESSMEFSDNTNETPTAREGTGHSKPDNANPSVRGGNTSQCAGGSQATKGDCEIGDRAVEGSERGTGH